MREEFRRRRAVIVDGLNSIPGFTCRQPHGAFYVFPNIRQNRQVIARAGGRAAGRSRRGLPLGHRLRRLGRRLPAFLVCQLGGEYSEGAGENCNLGRLSPLGHPRRPEHRVSRLGFSNLLVWCTL